MKIIQVFFIVIATSMLFSCNAQSSKAEEDTNVKASDEVQVYYFHTSRRCVTCKTVERVSKQAVQEMKSDEVVFAAHNLEKTEGEQIAEKLGVSGQALLVTDGDKKINITREGFMNARSNPEKLKQIVKQKVNSLQ